VKELLSKKFWQEVKKTFDEARAEPPANSADSQPPEIPTAPPDNQGDVAPRVSKGTGGT
jgi:hypothetical protein